MEDKKNAPLMIEKIDLLIKDLNDTWQDINNKEISKLKEAWNSESCIDYIEKLKPADKKINDITNRLQLLKLYWQKYSSTSVSEGETINE